MPRIAPSLRHAGLAATCLLAASVLWFRPAASGQSPDGWQSKIGTADLGRAASIYTQTRALPGEAEKVSCAVCHGPQGQGNYGLENPKHVAPHLAGLNAVYVGEQLRAYANGTRVFPLMH